jgi:acyl-CoA oxidase
MQQYRCFSALALSYSIRWAASWIQEYLQGVQKAINSGDVSAADEMPELHATLSGLKSWSTIIAHGHMEDLRKACGGQGFLRSSGMPDIVEGFCDPATVEGEQVIMALQCSRFLVKSAAQAKSNPEQLKGSVKYLLDAPVTKLPFQHWADARPEDLVAMFRDRARLQALRLQERFAVEQGQGSFDAATNATAIHGYKAAGAHSAFITISRNLDALRDFVQPKDERVYRALLNLFELNALVQIKDNLADWFHCLTPDLADSLMDQIHVLLDRIRPDAVGLVDAYGFDDEQLKSTLGRYDGNVYEAIYEEARISPLNQTPKMVGWEAIAPVLDLDFIKAGIGQRVLPAEHTSTPSHSGTGGGLPSPVFAAAKL